MCSWNIRIVKIKYIGRSQLGIPKQKHDQVMTSQKKSEIFKIFKVFRVSRSQGLQSGQLTWQPQLCGVGKIPPIPSRCVREQVRPGWTFWLCSPASSFWVSLYDWSCADWENEPYYSRHATRDPKAARVHRAVSRAWSGQRIQIPRKEILNCYQICQWWNWQRHSMIQPVETSAE